jgi:RNA polymerase sigma factor (sigma-70 family)
MSKSRILTEEPPEWVEKVWRKNASQIYKLCQTQSSDDDGAKDLFQEVALRLCRSASSLDMSKPIYPWLRAVVHNTYFDMNRRLLPVIPLSQLSDANVPYDMNGKRNIAQELQEQRKSLFVRQELDYLMKDLTAAERMAVEFHCIGEIRAAEACLYCGVNRGTFLSRKKVALKKMRKKKEVYMSKFKKNESSCLKLDDLLTRASEFS